MNDRILRQIAAALRTAEKAGTEAEADNAMQVAQRLATTHSIDLAVARSQGAPATRSTPTHRSITLGEPRKRGLRTYVELFLAIATANDVTCNIAHNSTYVVAFGFDDDIAVCEALYASLVVQMVRAGDGYLKRGSFRSELVWRQAESTDRLGRRRRRWEQVPLSSSMARINFHGAFAARVAERLVAARQQAQRDALAAERAAGEQLMSRVGGHRAGAEPGRSGAEPGRSGAEPGRSGAEPGWSDAEPGRSGGAELALVEKAAEIADYYRSASTARGTWRGGRATTDVSSDAQAAGRRAGSSARLGTEAAIGGARRALHG